MAREVRKKVAVKLQVVVGLRLGRRHPLHPARDWLTLGSPQVVAFADGEQEKCVDDLVHVCVDSVRGMVKDG
jgi:hypothetical protein